MQGIDGVFYLAALWLLQCHVYPRSAFDVNVVGTTNVAEAVMETGVKPLAYSSSASVYGDALRETMGEDHPLGCGDFYGASKVCGDVLLCALHHHSSESDRRFDFLGLRYMNVYGERQDDKGAYIGVVARMLGCLDAGLHPEIHGDGSQAYDFVHVRDCAQANVCAMASDLTDWMYNVGAGVKTSIATLAQKLSRLLPVGKAAVLHPSDRPFVRNRVGSTDLARQEIGITAAIELDAGLRDLMRWRATQLLEVLS